MNIDISTSDLRRAIAIRERIEALESELAGILGGGNRAAKQRPAVAKPSRNGRRKKRRLSPEARARIVAAVKARWERERSKRR